MQSLTAPRDMLAVQMKRQSMALLSYLMFLVPLSYSVVNGWVGFTLTGLGVFAIAAIGINGVFFYLIRSGYSRKFRDPSMTMVQMIMSIVLALVVIRQADQARPVMLLLFVACFFFGIFGLRRGQFWTLALGTIGAYALVVGSDVMELHPKSEQFKIEVLQFIALSMILCWISVLGGYVSRLRKHMFTQAAALSQALARLNHLVKHDELTSIYNRRHLLERLAREKEQTDQTGQGFSVCIIDIDHFKCINDTHGHQAGDEVLREFASRLRTHASTLLSPDAPRARLFFGRYGGEEFLMCLPLTPQDAAHCVDRLNALVQVEAIPTSGGMLSIQFSAGVAGYHPSESVESVIARADLALYQAKNAGRNRTVVAT